MDAVRSSADQRAQRCPSCWTPLGGPLPPACPVCRLPVGGELWQRVTALNARIAELTAERRALLAPPAPQRERSATPHASDGAGEVDPTPGVALSRGPDRPGAVRAWLGAAGPQTLLAAGGVLLLVIAAIVFTAVAWRELPLLLRGGLLLAASAGCAALTGSLTRRGLPRTAEATGVLSVALLAVLVNGLWRGGLLDGVGGGLVVFALTAVTLAAVSHLLARATNTGAPFVLAAWMAPAAAVAAGVRVAEALAPLRIPASDPIAVTAALLAGAAVGCAYAERMLAGLPGWRLGTQLAGVLLWLLSVGGLVLTLAGLAPSVREQLGPFAAALVLAAVGVGAAAGARRLGGGSRWWRMAGVAGMWFAATLGAAGALWERSAAWPQLQVVVPLALGIAALSWCTSRSARRGAIVGLLPITLAGLTVVADAVEGVLEVAVWRLAAPWTDVQRAALLAVGPSSLLSAFAVVALVVAVVWRVDRVAATATALAGGGMVGVAVGAAVWHAGGGSVVALGIVAGAAVAVRRHTPATVPLLAVLSATVLAVTLALATEALTIATLAIAAGVTLPAVATRDRRATVVAPALVTADVIGLVAAGVAAATAGPGPVGVAIGVAAAGAWMVASATRARPSASTAVEGTAAAAFGIAIGLAAAADAAPWLAVTLGLLAVAAAGVAVWRPDRRWMRWVATAAASASSWTVLSDLDIDLVEAYTVPPALAISALGAASLRAHPSASSWPVLGTGLSLLTVPTVAQLMADPGDLRRLVVTVVAGSVLAATGRALGLQSPLVAGVGALTMAALSQHDVITDLLPRWVLLAAAGTLLLWLSISYERQRERVAAATRRLATMR